MLEASDWSSIRSWSSHTIEPRSPHFLCVDTAGADAHLSSDQGITILRRHPGELLQRSRTDIVTTPHPSSALAMCRLTCIDVFRAHSWIGQCRTHKIHGLRYCPVIHINLKEPNWRDCGTYLSARLRLLVRLGAYTPATP